MYIIILFDKIRILGWCMYAILQNKNWKNHIILKNKYTSTIVLSIIIDVSCMLSE